MPTTYDSPWNEALDIYFEPFVAFFFPAAHTEIDWSRGYEALDKELQRIAPHSATGARTVDKLMKVWRRDGREEWILIHVEVQSQEDPEFLVRIWTTLSGPRNWSGIGIRLPPYSWPTSRRWRRSTITKLDASGRSG